MANESDFRAVSPCSDDLLYSWLYSNGYGEGPIQRLVEFAGDSLFNCRRILDAGCGLSGFARLMTAGSFGGEIFGVDISGFAVSKADKHTTVLHASLAALPVRDGWFEGLFCCDVLEHIHENRIRRVLIELNRVLAPSSCWAFSIGTGRSYCRGPNGENLHVNIKPSEWWLDTLQSSGFGRAVASKAVQGGVLVRGARHGRNE